MFGMMFCCKRNDIPIMNSNRKEQETQLKLYAHRYCPTLVVLYFFCLFSDLLKGTKALRQLDPKNLQWGISSGPWLKKVMVTYIWFF